MIAKQSYGHPAAMRSGLIPVVCVGLSAGGLKALKVIFERLNPQTGMAFVIISHVSPTQPTWLPQLLSSWSSMPAELARRGMLLEANHVYIIPPGQEILMGDGHFRVHPRSKGHGWPNVITLFLNSLVKSPRIPAGIAVILSGLDSDGAAALKEFHDKGGITIAQELSSADHKDMPRAAIATGFVDYVLAPEAIAGKIEEIATSGREHRNNAPLAGRH
jgi:chemotaxis response regulator CheB